jgi:DNA-binding HxlR family transcriptional regulator
MVIATKKLQHHKGLHIGTKLHLIKGKQKRQFAKWLLNRLADFNNNLFQSLETMVKDSGVSERTIQETLKLMEQLSIIVRKPRYKKDKESNQARRSTNEIHLLEWFAFEVKETLKGIIVKPARVVKYLIDVAKEMMNKKRPESTQKQGSKTSSKRNITRTDRVLVDNYENYGSNVKTNVKISDVQAKLHEMRKKHENN